MTPDLDVLVAAFRTDHPHHETAYGWLSQARRNCADASETLSLLPILTPTS